MSISFVQGANSPLISATNTTVSFGSNTTGGSLLVVYALTNGGFSTIADTLLNTWTNLYTDSTDSNVNVWYAINQAGGGADTITIQQTGASQIEIAAKSRKAENSVQIFRSKDVVTIAKQPINIPKYIELDFSLVRSTLTR